MNARFPGWVPLGALVLAAGYLPTLAAPFDFIDDGNLVYAAPPGLGFVGHVELWWQKVAANYDHLGPFRPTLWMHWQLAANLFGGDAFLWRCMRLAGCALSAGMLLWLMRELKAAPVAALLTAAAAMWNPYRNEIWTSLTLAEGVAMPYALLALIAARRATTSRRPWAWDAAALFGLVVALGCKNVFVALIPPMVVLRLWADGESLREACGRRGVRSLLLAIPVLLPAAHFVDFKQHWHAGQYETAAPSPAQFLRIASSLKGAISADFLGAAYLLAGGLVAVCTPGALRGLSARSLAAMLLVLGGVVVYLPMNMMSGRYSMPAVWGLDLLLAFGLSAFLAVPTCRVKQLAWVLLWGGLTLVAVANVGRQEKFAARARLLWDAVQYVEAHAPEGATIAWISGDSAKGALNVEEGIHFRWHLLHRGRADLRVALLDADGKPVPRVELPPPGAPTFRISGHTIEAADWSERANFAQAYWLGRKRYECHLSAKPTASAMRP